MLPDGFFGTRADILVDFLMVAQLIAFPVMLLSVRHVRRKDYSKHGKLQLRTGYIALVLIVLFEIDLRVSGGMMTLFKDSVHFQTPYMWISFIIHLVFALAAVGIWGYLLWVSPKAFGNPPQPAAFSVRHKRWGWAGFITLTLAIVTDIHLYIVGFVL